MLTPDRKLRMVALMEDGKTPRCGVNIVQAATFHDRDVADARVATSVEKGIVYRAHTLLRHSGGVVWARGHHRVSQNEQVVADEIKVLSIIEFGGILIINTTLNIGKMLGFGCFSGPYGKDMLTLFLFLGIIGLVRPHGLASKGIHLVAKALPCRERATREVLGLYKNVLGEVFIDC